MDDNQKIKFSKLASAIRGLADSASLGFMDEGIGGLKAGYQVATDPNKTMSDLPALYAQNRDKYRADTQDAEAQNPLSYKGGEAAGMLASTALPGSVVRAPGMVSAALSGAAYGGLSGLGHSDADTLGGMAQDTAKNAAVGAVAGPALHVATGAVANQFPALARMLGNRGLPQAAQTAGTTDLRNALDEGVSGMKFGKQDAADTANRISDSVGQKLQNKQTMNDALQSAQDVYENKVKAQGSFDPDATSPGTTMIPDDTDQIQKNLKLKKGS